MSSANKRQVGGSHYHGEYQHWDLVADTGMGYFEGQITKYIARWRRKNGIEDLHKAAHYLEKLEELNGHCHYHLRPPSPAKEEQANALARFYITHKELQPQERMIISLLATDCSGPVLASVRDMINALIEEEVPVHSS